MKTIDVIEGAKFHDDRLTSQPAHYRIHIVRRVASTGETFQAEHIASGTTRTFGLTAEVLQGLRLVSPPILLADLDSLVGEQVRIDLVDGGRLHGRVTAVTYKSIELPEGAKGREVTAVEIDRSGATSYAPREIARIVRV